VTSMQNLSASTGHVTPLTPSVSLVMSATHSSGTPLAFEWTVSGVSDDVGQFSSTNNSSVEYIVHRFPNKTAVARFTGCAIVIASELRACRTIVVTFSDVMSRVPKFAPSHPKMKLLTLPLRWGPSSSSWDSKRAYLAVRIERGSLVQFLPSLSCQNVNTSGPFIEGNWSKFVFVSFVDGAACQVSVCGHHPATPNDCAWLEFSLHPDSPRDNKVGIRGQTPSVEVPSFTMQVSSKGLRVITTSFTLTDSAPAQGDAEHQTEPEHGFNQLSSNDSPRPHSPNIVVLVAIVAGAVVTISAFVVVFKVVKMKTRERPPDDSEIEIESVIRNGADAKLDFDGPSAVLNGLPAVLNCRSPLGLVVLDHQAPP